MPKHLEPRPSAAEHTGTLANARSALAQAALVSAQQVIARTMNASRLAAPPQQAMTVQGRFYARLQMDLRAWIGCGGFLRGEPECATNIPSDSDQLCVD